MMVVLILLLAPPEPAMKPEAKRHLDAGLRLYDVQEYARAIEEFKAGYEVDARREFLYAMGQAQRLSGDCEHAILSYEAYLRTDPPPGKTEPARQNIERCRQQLAERKPPAPVQAAPPPSPAPPPPPPVVTTPAPVAPAPVERPRHWWADPVGDTLVVSGAAALVVGGLLWKSGSDDLAAAHSATQYGDFASHADGADTRETIGVVTLIAGGALVATGVVRYVLHSRTQVVPVMADGGAGLFVAGRF